MDLQPLDFRFDKRSHQETSTKRWIHWLLGPTMLRGWWNSMGPVRSSAAPRRSPEVVKIWSFATAPVTRMKNSTDTRLAKPIRDGRWVFAPRFETPSVATSRSVSVFKVKLSPGVQRSVRACTEPRMICKVQSYCVYRLASAGNFNIKSLITPQKNTMP